MGELHLEIIVDRMMREYKVEAMSASLRWRTARLFAETPKRKANTFGRRAAAVSTDMPRSGWSLNLRALAMSSSTISSAGRCRKKFIKPIDQGIKEAMEGGVLAGYEMVDVKAILYDGSYHDVDSNEMAFKIAGSMAFKEAARKASPVLLEPVMAVEVVTPEDYAGVIMGDLSSRRDGLRAWSIALASQVIKAIVPLAEMFGYATHMRSSTQGRAEYSMHFARYEEAPRSVSEEIIAKVQGTAK